jgi:hypothetical protein
MQQATSSISANPDLQTREWITHIKRRIWIYLLIIIAGGAYSFYVLKYEILSYSSTASFFVNENTVISSPTLDTKAIESITAGDKFNRVYELINSAPVRDHLINKFGLIKHYGIDTSSEFYYQAATSQLAGNIVVKKNPYNTISVTVSDKFRYLAAEMANDIVDYLEHLNQNYYVGNIKNKVEISQAFAEQLKKDNSRKTIVIDSIIRGLNYLISSAHLSDKNSFMLLEEQQKLSALINEFQISTNDLLNSQKLYLLSVQAMNFKTFPTITIIQSAMPAYRSIAITAFTYSLIVMILIFVVLIFQAYMFLHYRNYLRFIFKGK